MPIYNTYSKRQKALLGEVNDVFTYEEIPKKLRVQIVQIIDDAFGLDQKWSNNASEAYNSIHHLLCREFGVDYLGVSGRYDPKNQIFDFIRNSNNVNEVLDCIEILCSYIIKGIKKKFKVYSQDTVVILKPDEAISDLNQRFKENGVGYSFDGNQIIRIDSTYTHSEIIKPTINLLSNPLFLGANEEYLKAHEHYRHGLNKECITECAKAFESTMKIICTNKGWTVSSTDNASRLIQILMQNSLLPTTYQSQFSSLSNLLSSGALTIRNKLGAHGQGAVPQTVDDNITRYALNLTGSSIIFLIELSGL
jgi:hypothetical protein